MKKFNVCLLFLLLFKNTFSQNFGPGYGFTLFKNTPNWELSKAVEKEDTIEIDSLIKMGNYDINLQEPRFGQTLLLLAIGNDKLASTKSLLENGASVNIRDSLQISPILEASKFIQLKKNSLEILKLLVKFGENVNETSFRIKNKDTVSYDVLLMHAITNINCAKFLLDNNANLYVSHDKNFLAWEMMLILTHTEGIFVAKYLITEKKMLIPNPIIFSVPDKNPINIFSILNKDNFRGDSAKEEARREILDYLHKIDFPKNQVYNK